MIALLTAVLFTASPPPPKDNEALKRAQAQLQWLSSSSEAAKAKVREHVKKAGLK
jgi:hypothetical protein